MRIESIGRYGPERQSLLELLFPAIVRLIESTGFESSDGVWKVGLKQVELSPRPGFAVASPSSRCCYVSLPHPDLSVGGTVAFNIHPPLNELGVKMGDVVRELVRAGEEFYPKTEEPSLMQSWQGVPEFTLSPEMMDLAVALALCANNQGFVTRDDAYAVTREVRAGYRTAELHGVIRLIDPLCDYGILIRDRMGIELKGFWFTFEGRAIVGLSSSHRRSGKALTQRRKEAVDTHHCDLLDQRQKMGILFRDFCAFRIRMDRLLRLAGISDEIRAQMSHRDAKGSQYMRQQMVELDRKISQYERKKRK
jgi:hypothetical protein